MYLGTHVSLILPHFPSHLRKQGQCRQGHVASPGRNRVVSTQPNLHLCIYNKDQNMLTIVAQKPIIVWPGGAQTVLVIVSRSGNLRKLVGKAAVRLRLVWI